MEKRNEWFAALTEKQKDAITETARALYLEERFNPNPALGVEENASRCTSEAIQIHFEIDSILRTTKGFF